MAIAGDGYSLVGVSVAGGPLREPVHVELDGGLTAFYGVNGVGKSWLLKLVSSALTGMHPNPESDREDEFADLHIRIDNPESKPINTGAFLGALVDGLNKSVRERRGEYLQTDPLLDELAVYRLIEVDRAGWSSWLTLVGVGECRPTVSGVCGCSGF